MGSIRKEKKKLKRAIRELRELMLKHGRDPERNQLYNALRMALDVVKNIRRTGPVTVRVVIHRKTKQ